MKILKKTGKLFRVQFNWKKEPWELENCSVLAQMHFNTKDILLNVKIKNSSVKVDYTRMNNEQRPTRKRGKKHVL